jgi:hypothetical protein
MTTTAVRPPASADKKKQVVKSTVSSVCRLAARIIGSMPVNQAVTANPVRPADVADSASKAAAALDKVRQIAPLISRLGQGSHKVSTEVINRLAEYIRKTKLSLADLENYISRSNRLVVAQNRPEVAVPTAMSQSVVVPPTLKNLVADLLAIHTSYGPFDIDWTNKTITVLVAKDVVLDGAQMGDYQVVLFWGEWARLLGSGQVCSGEAVLMAAPTENTKYAFSDDFTSKSRYFHPHVNPADHRLNPAYGHICFGSAHTATIKACLSRGDLMTSLDIVKAVFNSYNPGSPYRKIDYWKPITPCGNCRGTRNVAPSPLAGCSHGRLCSGCRTTCNSCGNELCKRCFPACGACGVHRCARCVPATEMTSCARCDRVLCPGCDKACRTCHKSYCRPCLARDSNRGNLESRCDPCRKKIAEDALQAQRDALRAAQEEARVRATAQAAPAGVAIPPDVAAERSEVSSVTAAPTAGETTTARFGTEPLTITVPNVATPPAGPAPAAAPTVPTPADALDDDSDVFGDVDDEVLSVAMGEAVLSEDEDEDDDEEDVIVDDLGDLLDDDEDDDSEDDSEDAEDSDDDEDDDDSDDSDDDEDDDDDA